ncbi:hypothetical protein CCP2SC5_750005 [Azospirillaceae bacterium]
MWRQDDLDAPIKKKHNIQLHQQNLRDIRDTLTTVCHESEKISNSCIDHV